MGSRYIYKVACLESEFAQIHRLNHDTFANEIPQHPGRSDGILVDKFHQENTYFICLKDDELIGMIAARAKRPFSLDYKISELDSFLPPHKSVCEIRLLAIRKNNRAGYILFKLMEQIAQFSQAQCYDLLVMSGTLRQLKLYRHIGFVPFGPVVGTSDASYQPMYIQLNDLLLNKYGSGKGQREKLYENANFLPGPVGMHPDVYDAISEPAISHRSDKFIQLHEAVQHQLCRIVMAAKVEIFVGTGTLANDVIAGQLSLLDEKGLVLSNGEFGDRLCDHAERFRLEFEILQSVPGCTFDLGAIRKLLKADPLIRWLWLVHCETSTGILNDLEEIKKIATDFGLKLCVDCISSVGAAKVDLRGVFLASSVSGKCLGAFPGMAMVFYNHVLSKTAKKLPRYLDIEFCAGKNGIPFTGSYNLLNALHRALLNFDLERKMKTAAANSKLIIQELRTAGFEPVGDAENIIPSIITFELPKSMPSSFIGAQLEKMGIYISYNSEYLRQNNRIQICLMGSVSLHDIAGLLSAFRNLKA
jgi:aspartate aminotransferase-like enzyme